MRLLLFLGLVAACTNDTQPTSAILGATFSGTDVGVSGLSFPDTKVGTSVTLGIEITNTGVSATDALVLGGSGDFSIDVSSTCAGLALAASESCTIAVSFTPSNVGSRTGALTVSAGSSSLQIALSGTGLASGVSLSGSGSFGSVDVGATGIATITVTNDGGSIAALAAPAISGTGFSIDSTTCGSTLGVSNTCSIQVALAPAVLGVASGSLSLVADGTALATDLDGLGTYLLSVTNEGGGTVSSSPAGISCGTTCAGHFSTAVTLTADDGPNSTINQWSLPSCNGTTCVIDESTVPVDITAIYVSTTHIVYFQDIGDTGGVAEVGVPTDGIIRVTNDGTGTIAVAPVIGSNPHSSLSPSTTCGATLAGHSTCDVVVTYTSPGLVVEAVDVLLDGQTFTFAVTGGWRLTVVKQGTAAGAGVVTANPNKLSGCTSTTCSALFPGSSTLSTTGDFRGWSGACTGTTGCSLSAGTSARTVFATFGVLTGGSDLHFTGMTPGPYWIPDETGRTDHVTVVNDAATAIPLDSIQIVGPNNNTWITNNGCGTSLPVGGSCVVTIFFMPMWDGEMERDLEVLSNGYQYIATLGGYGVKPPL